METAGIIILPYTNVLNNIIIIYLLNHLE